MSSYDHRAEPPDRPGIIARLARLEARLDTLLDELEANHREYDRLQDTYRRTLAEHDHLTTRLRQLDSVPAAL
jgi:predicted nuclease with TOPRIM domain